MFSLLTVFYLSILHGYTAILAVSKDSYQRQFGEETRVVFKEMTIYLLESWAKASMNLFEKKKLIQA